MAKHSGKGKKRKQPGHHSTTEVAAMRHAARAEKKGERAVLTEEQHEALKRAHKGRKRTHEEYVAAGKKAAASRKKHIAERRRGGLKHAPLALLKERKAKLDRIIAARS